MKTLLSTLTLSLMLTIGYGQNLLESYKYWSDTALVLYNQGRFEEAINAFKVAAVCNDLPRKNNINQWIDSSYAGYIKLLTKERDKANEAQRRAEMEAKANEIAANALKMQKYDMTHALRIAEAGMKKFPGNSLARQSFVEILSASPPPFYQKKLEGHGAKVASIAANEDGSLIATAGWDFKVMLWNKDGSLRRTLEGHKDIVTSVAVFTKRPYIISGSADFTAILWDTSGQIMTTFAGHKLEISSVALSPDESKIATASWDGTVKIWNIEGKELMTLKGPEHYISSVDFSPDGKTILSASWDQHFYIWDLQGNLIQKVKAHGGAVVKAVYSPDGSSILTCGWDKFAKLWDKDGKHLATFSGHKEPVESICFSASSNRIYTGSWDEEIMIWDQTGKFLQTLKGHSATINSLFNVKKGDYILSASTDNTAIIWNTNGQLTQILKLHDAPVHRVSSSPDGSRFVTIGGDNKIKLWDRFGNLVKEMKTSPQPSVLKFSPKGNCFAVGHIAGAVKVFDQNGDSLFQFQAYVNADVNSIDISPDGQSILTGSFTQADLWKLDGSLITNVKGHKQQIWAIRFLPDGKTFLTGGNDNKIIHWDMEGNQLNEFSIKGTVSSICFARDENSFFVAANSNNDYKIYHFDLLGNHLNNWKAHEKNIYDLKPLTTDNYLVSIGQDQKAMVWDYHGNEFQVIPGVEGRALDISPDEMIVTADKLGNIETRIPFFKYLTQGYVASLSDEEQLRYGLIDSTEVKTEPNIEKPKLPDVRYHENFLRNELVLFEAQTTTDILASKRNLAMKYSTKAYNAPTTYAKIFYQEKSVKLFEEYKGSVKKMNSGGYNTQSFSYGCLSLWFIMDNQWDKAFDYAIKSIAIAREGADEDVQNWSKTIMIINHLARGQFDEAVSMVNEIKDIGFYDDQLVGIMQWRTIPKNYTCGDLIIEHLDLLKNAGAEIKRADEIREMIKKSNP